MKEEVIREIRYYSPVFKRQVVEEYLAGGITQSALQRKYDIRGKCAILYWRRQLSLMQDNPVSCNLATITPLEMAQKKQITGDQELRQRIKELERQLEDEKIRCELYARMIDKAEKELNTTIRKKRNTK